MTDFYPAITGRYSGRRVHVAPGRRPAPRARSGQTAKSGDHDHADLLGL